MTHEAAADRLTYRNGFIVARDGVAQDGIELAALPEGWRDHDVGGWRIRAHPDTEVHVVPPGPGPEPGPKAGPGAGPGPGDGEVVLVAFGQAFWPERGLFGSAQALAALAEALRAGLGTFHEALDEICGRFALLARTPQGWRVYHDAMGSRAVFYSLSRPVVASHVELLAEALWLRVQESFIPFVSTRGYLLRDVKYLPGAMTPYADLRQLTPNTALSLEQCRPHRYWPREDRRPHRDVGRASAALVAHVEGLRRHLQATGQRPVLGLTGGRDSRGLLAGLRGADPMTFTWVRSASGTQVKGKESLYAAELARIAGVGHEVLPIRAPSTLATSEDAAGRAYRRNTGYYRGVDGGWQRHLLGHDYPGHVFIRGFGGEVLRGFYQKSSKAIRRLNAKQLSNIYDVNAGTNVTRRAFREFIALTDMKTAAAAGYDPNDLFYWEHRMGTWGAIALTEGDIAMKGLSGYNSRVLFETFLGLDWDLRESCEPINRAIAEMSDALAELAFI